MDGLRWASAESWHITLQFLGSASAESYSCVTSRLGEIEFPPLAVRLTAAGIFERAGILFAGVRLSPELAELERLVTLATGKCGFVAETRQYQPHITLARRKGASGRKGLRKLERELLQEREIADLLSRTEFVADEFLLYESFTRPEGSHYEVRCRFPARGRAN